MGNQGMKPAQRAVTKKVEPWSSAPGTTVPKIPWRKNHQVVRRFAPKLHIEKSWDTLDVNLVVR
jgi:hypothetical protein